MIAQKILKAIMIELVVLILLILVCFILAIGLIQLLILAIGLLIVMVNIGIKFGEAVGPAFEQFGVRIYLCVRSALKIIKNKF